MSERLKNASNIFNPYVRNMFEAFFNRSDTFTLGVCNGCQMLSHLRNIIPGADHWPRFVKNLSEQFEARLSLVEVTKSPSLFLKSMAGSILPIATSHGEGRVEYYHNDDHNQLNQNNQVIIRYVDNYGQPANQYPSNPNGSIDGVAGFCSEDGRVTVIMPHPERVIRSVQHSWCSSDWDDNGPWLKIFHNAREWVD